MSDGDARLCLNLQERLDPKRPTEALDLPEWNETAADCASGPLGALVGTVTQH